MLVPDEAGEVQGHGSGRWGLFGPAVLLGDTVVQWVPIVWVHRVAELVFAAIGVAVLLGVGG